MSSDRMPAFASFPFKADGREKTVFTRGAGPGVLIMHELPGLVAQCVRLADYVASKGFTVFVPLLVGEANGPDSGLRTAANVARLCIQREILLFASEADSPLTTWLRALAVDIRRRCPDGRGIGVIGMCLTGQFAINLMLEDVVRAPVASQPALPLTHLGAARDALGVSRQTLEAAKVRARDVPLLCYRFAGDKLSPPERFQRLRQEFGAAFEGHELPGKAHSVLTISLVEQPGHPTYEARDRVIDFLRANLQ